MTRKVYILLVVICSSCYKISDDSFLEEGIITEKNQQVKNETTATNKWLFKQMNTNYYWYKEMPDSNSVNIELSAKVFFEDLLSPNDRFSWIEQNSDYSGFSMYDKYGIVSEAFQIYRGGDKVNRVLHVIPGSPAGLSGIKRGEWFKMSETGSQLVVTLGKIIGDNFIAQQDLLISKITKCAQTQLSVSVDSVFSYHGHKIGYIVYDQFEDGQGLINNEFRVELRDVFGRFQEEGISDFIIDLRYNPGGAVSICQYLCGLILSDEQLGKISGFHEFNDKLAQQHLVQTGNEEEILTFPTKTIISGKNLGISNIYAIVTNRTASASECLINTLKPFINVVLVGTPTSGKGVGSWTIKDDDYKWQIQPITFRYYNSLHQTVPDSGLIPDIFADESLIENLYELGDTNEYLLNTALQIILNTETKSALFSQKHLVEIIPLNNNDYLRRRVHGYIDFNHKK